MMAALSLLHRRRMTCAITALIISHQLQTVLTCRVTVKLKIIALVHCTRVLSRPVNSPAVKTAEKHLSFSSVRGVILAAVGVVCFAMAAFAPAEMLERTLWSIDWICLLIRTTYIGFINKQYSQKEMRCSRLPQGWPSPR